MHQRFVISVHHMPSTHAWSMFAKLLLADTTQGTVSLTVTKGGDLILTPHDARLTVHSGAYTGSCFRDGTVLFQIDTVRLPLCDLPVQTLPLQVKYKDTVLLETDDEWTQANFDNLNAAAPERIPMFTHEFKSLHAFKNTEGSVRQLLAHVFPLSLDTIDTEPFSETMQTTDDVLNTLTTEMALCKDELLCVAMQAVAKRLGIALEIPTEAIEATDSAMQTLSSLAAYEDFETDLPLPQLRTFVGAHNFDVNMQSIYLQQDVSQQTQMRIAAQRRGGLMSTRISPPPPVLFVNGQSEVTEAQPHDTLRVENVGYARVYLDTKCVQCVPGNTEFTIKKCGAYTINGIAVNIAYNIANIGSWKIITDDTFENIEIVADDKYSSDEARSATRWRFQNNVHARFNTVTIPLTPKDVGVYCIQSFEEDIWRLVSVSGADVTMQVCYGRLSTSKLWVNLDAALSKIDRPDQLGYSILGSAFGNLFPSIKPALLNRARSVCQGGVWQQSDGQVQNKNVPTADLCATAQWLMDDCELQYGLCKLLVPGTLQAIAKNDTLLPFILSNGESDQLTGFTTLPLPQFMPLYLSDGPIMHNLSGVELKWGDGFRVIVLECGLHISNQAGRHEQLIFSDNKVVVKVNVSTPTSTVLRAGVGCFAFVVNYKTYIYNTLPDHKAFVVHGIISEPQAEVSLSTAEGFAPFFTQSPACVPMDIDTSEITTCWGTGLCGNDVLDGKLTGLLPPFTVSSSLVLHPNCNSRTPSGLIEPTLEHTLLSSLFACFGYNPDDILPWSVFDVYEPVRKSAKFQQILKQALCNHPVSMMACYSTTDNPYPDTTIMQLKVPSTVLVAHAESWSSVSLSCVVDGTDVFIRGVCISEQGALYAAIRDLPDGHSHCIALDAVPNEPKICKALQLFLRCFLVGDVMTITLPALLWEKEKSEITYVLEEEDNEFDFF